jgi:membrane protein implicated in regulation of membrane protease activity
MHRTDKEAHLNHVYLGAVAFGVTLLLASFVLGGKDTDHGGHGHADSAPGFGWAPFSSLRFWVFLLTFGGGAGLALDALESSEVVAGVGALAVGWVSGAIAVTVIRKITASSSSSLVSGSELVGMTGTLVLPVGNSKPGKVRVDIKGRTEDFVANLHDPGNELVTGTHVVVVAEGDLGSLLVTKHEL